MTWTAPRTWTTGETVSASVMNAHVRDNLLELRTARAVRAKASSTQSIADSTMVAINLGAEDYDPNGWHHNTTNNSRIKPTVAGTYRISGLVEFDRNATGIRAVAIYLNGVSLGTRIAQTTVPAVDATYTQPLHISTEYAVNGSTDYFEICAFQSSGGALNAVTAIGSHLTVSWIGA